MPQPRALGSSVKMISLQPRFPDRAIEAWRLGADALWIAGIELERAGALGIA